MADDNPDSASPQDRRQFFRDGLSRLLQPAAAYLEKKMPGVLPPTRDRLRPPGALAEAEFLSTCYRCGSCADHCPADAITLLKEVEQRALGTPVVEPERRACVICDDLACMNVCPSGALRMVNRLEIRMGIAVVDPDLCVRSQGDDCTLCIDPCPIGPAAIKLVNDRVEVMDPRVTGSGCTGCGVCQEVCPTRPTRAIRVRPYDAPLTDRKDPELT